MPYKQAFFLSFIVCLFMLHVSKLEAQTAQDVFIRLTEPLKEMTNSDMDSRYIIGSTCKSCSLLINNEPVSVYTSGAFVYKVKLDSGLTFFEIIATDVQGKKKTKKVSFSYRPPAPPQPTKDWAIDQIQVLPKGDCWLKENDHISFRVKAKSGGKIIIQPFNITLHELPDSLTQGMPGIYQGTYFIKATDTATKQPWTCFLISPQKDTIQKINPNTISIVSNDVPLMVETKGRLAYLEYGMGDDRLGGAKMGYLDSLIRLHVDGKIDQDYRVQLTPNRHAYIAAEHVRRLAPGVFIPQSLTGKIKLIGKEKSDQVQVQLFQRLPYQTQQRLDPAMIVLDVFGATINTNWIDQPDSITFIKRIQLEQVADEHVRVYIYLHHAAFWGHRVFYEGNNLVVDIKHPPVSLKLNDLTIALDAGHGGSNTGAAGALNIAEKTIALSITQKLDERLRKAGAKTILTRNADQTFDNKERILFYRDSLPDLLLSIHLNSSADPLKGTGTSTFYRYEGFRPLSRAIYKRMLTLGLPEYGNNGAFNFMLNGPTEYPNALIECLFLSNPVEEMKILNDDFQWKLVDQIMEGLKDYLQEQASIVEDAQ